MALARHVLRTTKAVDCERAYYLGHSIRQDILTYGPSRDRRQDDPDVEVSCGHGKSFHRRGTEDGGVVRASRPQSRPCVCYWEVPDGREGFRDLAKKLEEAAHGDLSVESDFFEGCPDDHPF